MGGGGGGGGSGGNPPPGPPIQAQGPPGPQGPPSPLAIPVYIHNPQLDAAMQTFATAMTAFAQNATAPPRSTRTSLKAPEPIEVPYFPFPDLSSHHGLPSRFSD